MEVALFVGAAILATSFSPCGRAAAGDWAGHPLCGMADVARLAARLAHSPCRSRFFTGLLIFVGNSGPAKIPLSMLMLFVCAKVMAEISERLGQPGIVGEILAGVLIGPSVLGWMGPNEFLNALSDLGAMFLLFRVGLEVKRRSS